MSTGQRIGIIALGVIAIIGLVMVVEAMMSGTDVPEGKKPYMHAVDKQLGLDEKEFEKGEYDEKGGYDEGRDEKGEYDDLDGRSPEEYEAQFNAMLQEGKITVEQAEAKMEWVRQDLDK